MTRADVTISFAVDLELRALPGRDRPEAAIRGFVREEVRRDRRADPKLGMSTVEVDVVAVHVSPGDRVEPDTIVVEVQSEKVNFEIEAALPEPCGRCSSARATRPRSATSSCGSSRERVADRELRRGAVRDRARRAGPRREDVVVLSADLSKYTDVLRSQGVPGSLRPGGDGRGEHDGDRRGPSEDGLPPDRRHLRRLRDAARTTRLRWRSRPARRAGSSSPSSRASRPRSRRRTRRSTTSR